MRGRLCIHYRMGYELGQEAVLKAYGSPSAQRTLWPCRDPGRGREVGRRVVMGAELGRKGDLDSAAPAQSVARQGGAGPGHTHTRPRAWRGRWSRAGPTHTQSHAAAVR